MIRVFEEAVDMTENAFAGEGLETTDHIQYRSLTVSAVKDGGSLVTDTYATKAWRPLMPTTGS